jgi:hypothetical protein
MKKKASGDTLKVGIPANKKGSPVLSVDLGGRISSLGGLSNRGALQPMDAAAPAENAEAKLEA